MLLYDSEKLENLLNSLFEDESPLEDVMVIDWPDPFGILDGNCCVYNNTAYGG